MENPLFKGKECIQVFLHYNNRKTPGAKDNMFDKLMNYYYEYHVFHNITNELTLAQSILNIPINWYDLGNEFINFYDRH